MVEVGREDRPPARAGRVERLSLVTGGDGFAVGLSDMDSRVFVSSLSVAVVLPFRVLVQTSSQYCSNRTWASLGSVVPSVIRPVVGETASPGT